MKTICFSSLKGGSGKSSLSIITTDILSQSGYKVLALDMDIQNSLSYQYTKDMDDIDPSKNLYAAITEQQLTPHIQNHPVNPNIDFVLSDLKLLDIQEQLPALGLKNLLASVADDYDFAVIDSAPTYNSLVQNAYYAADQIVIPVELSLFDVKSLGFLFSKLQSLAFGKIDARILINKFDPGARGSAGLTGEYLGLIGSDYNEHLMKTRIPFSAQIRSYIDTGKAIPKKSAVRKSLLSFAAELTALPKLSF